MGLEVSRLRDVKMLILDVDGILTDCRIFLSDSGEWRRQFSIRDGYGLQRLIQAGYKTAIITGSKAIDIKERAKVLGIHYFYEGSLDKKPAFESLLSKTGLSAGECAYMGDDSFDVPILKQVAFAATVPDAMEEAAENSHYITQRPAGNGAVREVCEIILKYGAMTQGRL